MTKNNDKEFVIEYKKFYQMFFECIANSVDYLSNIHKKYPEQYDRIVKFSENPESIEEIIEKIPIESQAVLLRLLLKAGEFGRKFVRLMDMTAEEKKEFASDLKKFAEELNKM